jgi:hypothetical protein
LLALAQMLRWAANKEVWRGGRGGAVPRASTPPNHTLSIDVRWIRVLY